MDQRVCTPTQQRWLTKLLGYDFEVHYEKGKENCVANALSRQLERELVAITTLVTWLQQLKSNYTTYELISLLQRFYRGQLESSKYTMRASFLLRENLHLC